MYLNTCNGVSYDNRNKCIDVQPFDTLVTQTCNYSWIIAPVSCIDMLNIQHRVANNNNSQYV